MKTSRKFADIQVHEIMTRRVHAIMAGDTIHEALAIMVDNGVNMLPVVDSNNKCVGVLSGSDLTDLFLEEDQELSRALDTDRLSIEWANRSLETSDVRQVKELMTYEVTQVSQSQSLAEASREMVRGQIHRLPVVDEEGYLAGIISTFDIVKAVAESD